MDLQGILSEMASSLDNLEEQFVNAENEAEAAELASYEAKQHAYEAEEKAEWAKSSAREGQAILGTLREEFSQLQELIEEMETNLDEKGEKDPKLSDLQKDIAKHKVKVLKIKERNPGATSKAIAEHLGIGEFLVSRILELESTRAA